MVLHCVRGSRQWPWLVAQAARACAVHPSAPPGRPPDVYDTTLAHLPYSGRYPRPKTTEFASKAPTYKKNTKTDVRHEHTHHRASSFFYGRFSAGGVRLHCLSTRIHCTERQLTKFVDQVRSREYTRVIPTRPVTTGTGRCLSVRSVCRRVRSPPSPARRSI